MKFSLRGRDTSCGASRRGSHPRAAPRETGRCGASAGRKPSRGGRGRSLDVHNEVTAEWWAGAVQTKKIQMEGYLSRMAYRKRTRSYASALVANVVKEVVARSLPAGKSKFVVMLCHPSVSKCVYARKQGGTSVPQRKQKRSSCSNNTTKSTRTQT